MIERCLPVSINQSLVLDQLRQTLTAVAPSAGLGMCAAARIRQR
jgi:hypothetical protein